jgi:mannose-6-phosphate isomerase-like protein (cupin superfamily)
VHDARDYVRAQPEELEAVRNPSRPLAQYKLDGVTMNMVVARWETNGVREIWQARMDQGFHAEWNDYPLLPELFYVTEGRVKFTVYGEEYVAYEDCLVKIPRYAPHSLVAETDAAMYDLGGLSVWELFLHDYTALLKNDPEKAKDPETLKKLKASYQVYIKSIGKR